MSSANTTEEMIQISEHNKQQTENLRQTEKGVKTATGIVATVVGTPLAIAAGTPATPGAILSTEGYLLKGGMSIVTQAFVNDGKVDPLTVATDAFLAPGAGSVIDAAIDVNVSPETGFDIDVVGLDKTPQRAAIDFLASFGFGTANSKATGVMLRYSETQAEQYFYKIFIGVSSGVASSKVAE